MRNRAEWQLPGARGGENRELAFGYRISVWKDEKVLGIDEGDGCTIM